MKKQNLILLFLSLAGCFKGPSNELEAMTEEVIKKHEGVDVKIMPVDVEKAR